jgi:PAS domain S-box-containing protein
MGPGGAFVRELKNEGVAPLRPSSVALNEPAPPAGPCWAPPLAVKPGAARRLLHILSACVEFVSPTHETIDAVRTTDGQPPETHMTKLIDWIVNHLPWGTIVGLLRQLARRRQWVLILATCLLLGAVGFGYLYWIRSTRYEGVIRDALQRECMPTAQIYKGSEAFIVSSMPDNVEADLTKRALSAPFVDALRGIPSELANAQLDRMPTLTVAPGNGGIVLSDNEHDGFLFLPIQVLRPSFTEAERQLFVATTPEAVTQRAKLLTDTLSNDLELRRDIAFTAALAPTLHRLATTTVTTDTRDKPQQVYVITKNGLNRIINANAAGISAYQFPETTFFPSRPYFWPVFDEVTPRRARTLAEIAPPDGAQLGSYFTVSKPYMDLGGNGLVVTVARGILVDGYPRAVLCVDLPVHTSVTLTDLLRGRVASLGGYSMIVTCDVTGSTSQCLPTGTSNGKHEEDDPLTSHMHDTLQDRQVRQRRADILGNIIVLNSSSDSDTIEASLPLGVADAGKERFLLISMNLVRYRRLTTLVGVGAATCIGLMTLLLAYFGGMQAKQSQDYHAAFARVAQVMAESPTPYVRLDSDDFIRDFSGSFLELIGYEPDDADKLCTVKFRSLLADERNRDLYDNVEGRRRKSEEVEPYHLALKRTDGKVISVRIVSAAVPDSRGGEMPETFGLLLRPSEENLVPVDFVTAARLSLRRDVS